MMTLRKYLFGAASMAVVLTLAGCSAQTDDGGQAQGQGQGQGQEDQTDAPPTAEETAAGQAWAGGDGSENADEDTASLSSQEESSAPYLDESPQFSPEGVQLEPLAPEDLNQIQSCRRATGYRSGRAFTICITTVDGKPVEVNTAAAYLRMKRAARNRGVYLWINSGFRTMAQQRYLYNCYRTKRCNGGNLAAPPGYSNHQSGHALDLNTSARGVYSFLKYHGGAYGFRRTVPSEIWHWEH
jgi:LAS superfamily LD-carboxypeptidase LdcB